MGTSKSKLRLRGMGVGLAVLALLPAMAWPEAVLADDITAPNPPNEVFVEQGSEWRSGQHFDIWWHTPPSQESPIALVHYQLCPAVPLGPCTQHRTAGPGISELGLDLPHIGWFWLRIWLEDAAGNVNSGAKTTAVMLRFDDEVPPTGVFQHEDGWLGADTPASSSYTIQIDSAGEWPISGVRGYSVTTDGTPPDDNVDVFATQDYESFQALYALEDLDEGVTDVRVRTISNSGVSSGESTASIRLDRTPPVVAEIETGDHWHRDGVLIDMHAEDQDHLSGMQAADTGNPVEEGAYLAYQLDTEPTILVPGGENVLEEDDDGHHTLTYRAFDAAGNGSVEKEVRFKIDRTAPVGEFRALDPADPRELRVDVEDSTSGIARGAIEYRRVGDGGFTRLATRRDGGRLTARLDDQALPAGRYDVRAVVTDVAGNEAMIDTWTDGSSATLAMPLRLAANVNVSGIVKAKGCARKSAKRRGKDGRRKRTARRKCATPKTKAVSALALGFGRPATTRGRLTTEQGVPIASGNVVVEGQLRSGGSFARLGVARTDANGNFGFKLPAGPSRTVRYRYDGTNTVRPAAAQLTTKVQAAARLKTSHRRRRNGQAVRFIGRLLGKPIPRAGKVVALQAKVGREWRTFATPRANAKGIFRHRYRFTSTTGVRRYAFRAVVAREGAYPYEAGKSRIVKVTVRGR